MAPETLSLAPVRRAARAPIHTQPPAPAPDCDANGACLDESYDEYGEDEDDEAEDADADADADADGEAEDVDVAEAEGVNNGVSPIAALTPFEFDHLVVYPQGPVQFDWLIHFKTDWCERCNEAEEVITNVAQVFVDEHAAAAGNQTALESETFVRVGEVDCGWYPSICEQFSAMSYPTIALVTHTDKTVYLYEGDRQHADELNEFVIKRGQGQGLIKFAGTISDSMPQEWTKYTMVRRSPPRPRHLCTVWSAWAPPCPRAPVPPCPRAPVPPCPGSSGGCGSKALVCGLQPPGAKQSVWRVCISRALLVFAALATPLFAHEWPWPLADCRRQLHDHARKIHRDAGVCAGPAHQREKAARRGAAAVACRATARVPPDSWLSALGCRSLPSNRARAPGQLATSARDVAANTRGCCVPCRRAAVLPCCHTSGRGARRPSSWGSCLAVCSCSPCSSFPSPSP